MKMLVEIDTETQRVVPVAFVQKVEAAHRAGHPIAKETLVEEAAALLAASPQPAPVQPVKDERKPLLEAQISAMWAEHERTAWGKTFINPIVFARAIERAHGIGSSTEGGGNAAL